MPEPGAAEMLRYQRPKHLKLVVIIVACSAIVIAALGLTDRFRGDRKLVTVADDAAIPTVSIISPTIQRTNNSLTLPGSIQAFYQAPIYAQVSGYLQNWYTDIGARVTKGQLMAVIETPDLDQQLEQAKADLATAVANQQLAVITARRWNALLAKDAVSQQAADDKNSDLAAKTAIVSAARANVDRLEASEAFKRIVAPFDGVVTSRSTDVGALITVGAPNQPSLFTVDDERQLRIYVRVPQADSAEIKPGSTATFTVPQYPDRPFTATLTSTASAVDPNSGTLLAEFQTANPDYTLQPGDYADVQIALLANPQTLSVPSTALMFQSSGMEVATVDAFDRVIIKRVTLGRDRGASVDVTAGLVRTDRIIDNPPDWLEAGDSVQIANSAVQNSMSAHVAD